MTDHCVTDFCIWRTICLVPVRCISSMCYMYMTDFAYDGPIFLVPLSPSYPSSPVYKLSFLPMFQCFPWHKNSNAVIIGDAAHAMVPFYGQGMNCVSFSLLGYDPLWSSLCDGPASWPSNLAHHAHLLSVFYLRMRGGGGLFEHCDKIACDLEGAFSIRFFITTPS